MSTERNVENRWMASTNEEYWSGEDYSTKEEAVDFGREENDLDDDEGFWVGRVVPFSLTPIDSEQLLEAMFESGHNEEKLGDWAEGWLDRVYKNKELSCWINGKLREISEEIIRVIKPSFYNIKDMEYIEPKEAP